MTLRTLCAGLLLCASFTATAGEILNSDQLNLLRIESRSLIEERDFDVEQLVLNEKKIEMLLAWASGDKPSTLKDKVAPAAGAITAGASATALLAKYIPEVIARLPLNVQRIIKVTPAIAGLIASVYFAHDTVEYSNLKNQIVSVMANSNLNGQKKLYLQLLANREYLGKQIETLTIQINALDAQLNMYK